MFDYRTRALVPDAEPQYAAFVGYDQGGSMAHAESPNVRLGELGGDPPCWAHLLDSEGGGAMDEAAPRVDESAENDGVLDPTAQVQM